MAESIATKPERSEGAPLRSAISVVRPTSPSPAPPAAPPRHPAGVWLSARPPSVSSRLCTREPPSGRFSREEVASPGLFQVSKRRTRLCLLFSWETVANHALVIHALTVLHLNRNGTKRKTAAVKTDFIPLHPSIYGL